MYKVRIPRCCSSLWLLALEILSSSFKIFTVSEREGLTVQLSEASTDLGHYVDRGQEIFTSIYSSLVLTLQFLYYQRKFFSSSTRLSSVVLTILALVVYAISPPDDSWFVVGVIAVHVVPVIVVVMIYEICSIRQARDRARIASVNHLIDSDELHHYVPPLEAFPTRRRLQDLRLQIALLNREVDEFEHHTYGELSSGNIFGIPSMNDEEINALPVHNFKDTCLESEDAPPKQASSSSTSASDQESMTIGMPDDDGSSDELICNICLEPVIEGDLVCCFPCIHQFHAACLDKWLVLSSSCPVCNLC